MRLLAIETSCDETALALVETRDGKLFHVLANNVLSQIALHRTYGGVFPALAKREHARALVPLLEQTLRDAGLHRTTSRHIIEHPLRPDLAEIFTHEPELFAAFLTQIPSIDPPAIDVIAVTEGPGLEPALWVGINFAKALGMLWKVPVLPINHMEGHFISALMQQENTENRNYQLLDPPLPILGLLVSGGHTELVLMGEYHKYVLVGETKDDAVGEAFDKVARLLGLPYPGGPEIAKRARLGSPNTYQLPRPMLRSGDFHFSFSGLKTAVLYLIQQLGGVHALTEQHKADIARAFEEACVAVLVEKTINAAKQYGARTVIVGGGVSANLRLRTTLHDAITQRLQDVRYIAPDPSLSTDNALMIAVAAATKCDAVSASHANLSAKGNLRIG